MSRLPTDAQPEGLESLEGWGKIKKKLKLNKLKTRKLTKKVIGKKNYDKLKQTGHGLKDGVKRNALAIGAGVLTVATGGAAAPALIAAGKKMAATEVVRKVVKRKAEKDQKKALKAMIAAQKIADRNAEAEAEAEQEAEDSAPASISAPSSGASYGAGPSATAARQGEAAPAAAAEEKKPNYLGWAAGGLLAVKVISMVV